MSSLPPPAQVRWSPNVILVDADYIDRVAFHLVVNFERMLGRRIPPADLPQWLDCIALDGGLRPGENDVQVVLFHSKGVERMQHFSPADFTKELDGVAFKDNLGEFTLQSVEVEDLTSTMDLLKESIELMAQSETVQRVMVVADMEGDASTLLKAVADAEDKKKAFILFGMQPLAPAKSYTTEILGYSLTSILRELKGAGFTPLSVGSYPYTDSLDEGAERLYLVARAEKEMIV